MSKHHHRDRSWAPAPEALPDDAQTIDNHTHVASVIPFARAMSHEAQEKGQPEVPVYDVDQLLAQAQSVGIGGIIDCGWRAAAPDDRRPDGPSIIRVMCTRRSQYTPMSPCSTASRCAGAGWSAPQIQALP